MTNLANRCRNGHDLESVGVQIVVHKQGPAAGRRERRCRQCVRDGIARSQARSMALRSDPLELVGVETERFWRRVDKSGDCWLWKGPLNNMGYGATSVAGYQRLAHRVSYRSVRGEIPEGAVLDHLCRTPRCVRPDHLEPVTHRENLRRGKRGGPPRQAHCKRGHPLSGDNLYEYTGKTGRLYRSCRACQRVRHAMRATAS